MKELTQPMCIDELSHVKENIPVIPVIKYSSDFWLECEMLLQSQSWNMKLPKAGGKKSRKYVNKNSSGSKCFA